MPIIPATAPAEVEELLRLFDLGRVAGDLRRLCRADFAGRRVATPGHDRAQEWLKDRMSALGFAVALTPFTLGAAVLDVYEPPCLAIEGSGTQLRYRIDYAEHPRSPDLPKLVVGDRWATVETVPRGEELDKLAADRKGEGFVGLLLPQLPSQGFLSKRIVAHAPVEFPLVAVASALLPQLAHERLQIKLPLRRLAATSTHVIGVLQGRDRRLDREPILLGAHYDGVGDDTGGFRLPGAADNAAAVAVVLEAARVLATAGPQERPIWIAAFDAEEVDARGTRVYAETLVAEGLRPLVLNLDMAAQLHSTIVIEPSATAPTRTLNALDQAGEWLEQPLAIGNVSSDNRRFAQVGLETVGIGLGGNGIHTPIDSLENVEQDAMLAAGRLLLTTAWQLANQTD